MNKLLAILFAGLFATAAFSQTPVSQPAPVLQTPIATKAANKEVKTGANATVAEAKVDAKVADAKPHAVVKKTKTHHKATNSKAKTNVAEAKENAAK